MKIILSIHFRRSNFSSRRFAFFRWSDPDANSPFVDFKTSDESTNRSCAAWIYWWKFESIVGPSLVRLVYCLTCPPLIILPTSSLTFLSLIAASLPSTAALESEAADPPLNRSERFWLDKRVSTSESLFRRSLWSLLTVSSICLHSWIISALFCWLQGVSLLSFHIISKNIRHNLCHINSVSLGTRDLGKYIDECSENFPEQLQIGCCCL